MIKLFVIALAITITATSSRAENCDTPVKVKHTNHATHGDTGKYFFFDRTAFTDMVGTDAWDGSTFAIRQRGSQYWTGTVKVWKDLDIGAHGRRDSGEGS